MLKRGWTTHIVNLSSKKRRFTTSNIKTLTATYLSVLHVKVSSFATVGGRHSALADEQFLPKIGVIGNRAPKSCKIAYRRLQNII